MVQLPYYTVHPFNADPQFTDLLAAQWRAEWAYFNSSAYHAGARGRYGLGAGTTEPWCAAGAAYKADLIDTTVGAQTCRMYSPYAVAGYLPADPPLITSHLLDLLSDGEAVLPTPNGGVVMWRKSLLDPGWSLGYGITLVDVAAELYGLATLWLPPDFYQNVTNHFPPRR